MSESEQSICASAQALQDSLRKAKQASRQLSLLSDKARQEVLASLAKALRENVAPLLQANAQDLTTLPEDDPRRDRLLLTPERIHAMAEAVEHVATLPDILWEVLEERTMPSGIHLRRVRVPLGVVGCIYEARPNVTTDIAALCLRTGNVAVLKGGKEVAETQRVLARLFAEVLQAHGLPAGAITLLPPTHEAAEALMTAEGFIDALIPRGSARLIRAVREKARVPVIETGAGVCHTYVHEDADLALAARVIANAKTRRVSVCNALDTVLVHRALESRLEELLRPCREKGVALHDEPEAWGREWLSLNLSVRIVDSLDGALEHIARYGSGHSEAIITQSPAIAERFQREVDAACVYVNTSTAFTDGGEFGLGAEVGISTQKLHARGPMGLAALTTYKWLITSDGAIRQP